MNVGGEALSVAHQSHVREETGGPGGCGGQNVTLPVTGAHRMFFKGTQREL